jgi:hypothetical protein
VGYVDGWADGENEGLLLGATDSVGEDEGLYDGLYKEQNESIKHFCIF